MTARPWRGTLIFVGTLTAAVGAVGARIAVAPDASPAPAADTASDTGSSDTGSSSDPTDTTTVDPGTGDSANSGTVTVVGDVEQTRYGPVQVSVTFVDGAITAVDTLQSPSGHHESTQINARAVPILEQEAIAAQSANIDTVSGATYTSDAYRASLQSAIDQLGG